jgi:hypothetical protein
MYRGAASGPVYGVSSYFFLLYFEEYFVPVQKLQEQPSYHQNAY